MPVRHILLGALAVLVFGGTVYLFLEVRASPAAPQPRSVAAKVDDTSDTEKDDAAPAPADAPRTGDRARTGGRRYTRQTGGGTTVETPTPPTGTDPPDATVDATAGVKLDTLMAEANRAYDKQDFDEAKTIANKVLRQQPGNARMLRILVSTACIDHDATEAQKHYNLLVSKADRDAMRTRCQRDYGIALVEPPPKK